MVTDSKLSYEELLQIVKTFETSSQFSEFHLKYGDIVIDLRKHGAEQSIPKERMPVAESSSAPSQRLSSPVEDVAARPVQPSSPGSQTDLPSNARVIKSPMVGTFYVAPEPGARPFVTVGERVAPETIVCIIDVMKLMHSIHAECSGVVTHLLVEDGNVVEFGQHLMIVDTAG